MPCGRPSTTPHPNTTCYYMLPSVVRKTSVHFSPPRHATTDRYTSNIPTTRAVIIILICPVVYFSSVRSFYPNIVTADHPNSARDELLDIFYRSPLPPTHSRICIILFVYMYICVQWWFLSLSSAYIIYVLCIHNIVKIVMRIKNKVKRSYKINDIPPPLLDPPLRGVPACRL